MKAAAHLSMLALFLAISTQTPAVAQVPWTKDAANPVMSGGESGSWDRHVFNPRVLYNPDSSRFEMWYGASSADRRPYSIGFAYSPDGLNWTRHPSPVLEAEPGTWDAGSVEGPTIIRENGMYKMWYNGGGGFNESLSTGYATSPDGITWTKYAGNPVMTPGPAEWESVGIGYTAIVSPSGGGYQMWYQGVNSDTSAFGIGYATSGDGINWSKADDVNPVLTTGPDGSWDDFFVDPTTVLIYNDKYHLWYSGLRSDQPRWVGYASSDDGIHWEKYDDPNTGGLFANSDPVLSPGSDYWDRDYVESPSVLVMDGVWHMWYAGTVFPSNSNLWRIGYATSPVLTGFEHTPIRAEYVLDQNFPNPFNPTTTISYDLSRSSEVTLTVYDVLGRQVSVLASGMQPAGSHSVDFDATGCPPGVYYYRFEAGGIVETRQMVLVR